MKQIEGLGYPYWDEDKTYLRTNATPFTAELLGGRGVRPFSQRDWFHVEFQGQMGSCSGHMMAGAQRVLNKVETGSIVNPSRMMAYLLGQKFSGTWGVDGGATIAGSVRGAMTYGNCLERLFPYPERYSTGIPKQAIKQAGNHKIHSHVDLKDYTDVASWLSSGTGVVLIGIGWTEAMAQGQGFFDEQSVFNYRLIGGHALLICGINERRDRLGRFCPEGPNSHGVQHDDKGWIVYEPSLFDRWGRGEGPFPAEMIGVSKFTPFQLGQRMNWVRDNVL